MKSKKLTITPSKKKEMSQEEFVEDQINKSTNSDKAKFILAHIHKHMTDAEFSKDSIIISTDDNKLITMQILQLKEKDKEETNNEG